MVRFDLIPGIVLLGVDVVLRAVHVRVLGDGGPLHPEAEAQPDRGSRTHVSSASRRSLLYSHPFQAWR